MTKLLQLRNLYRRVRFVGTDVGFVLHDLHRPYRFNVSLSLAQMGEYNPIRSQVFWSLLFPQLKTVIPTSTAR